MDMASLLELCENIRHRILEVVSKNGGHLSSTLGAVELIVGMHRVFDCRENPFIYDVSHQAYAHKLITNRWKEFETLRQFGGMSGFIKPSESDFDYFIAGHSSTSISLGVGVAKAFALQKKNAIPVALIGDGSMSAGLVYEALNELGDRKYPMIIILNDNEMSIAKPIGAISKYLSHLIAGPMYQSVKDRIKKLLEKMPDSATYIAKRFEESFKLITPGILFEEMGINYIGPINGHHLDEVIHALNLAKDMRCPVIIHAQTTKGKGYEIAEGRYEKWHGVGPFDLDTGSSKKATNAQSPTDIYSQTLLELANEDEKIVGATAAMPGGTGLGALIDKYPNRFWDVAIAEQHAVTSMAALAKEGFKPFVSIYSTFLQRAYDQIVHDVGIMSLPVRFAIDRAGIVGEDGETHQGLLDISFLRPIPNMVLFAPRDNASLKSAILFASNHSSSPCAFRYPRGKFIINDGIFENKDFIIGKSELLLEGGKILLIGYGNGVGRAYEVYLSLKTSGIEAGLLDLRFLKPLDKDLKKILNSYSYAFVFSDSYKIGGVGSALLEYIADNDIQIKLHSFEVKDSYISHGNTGMVEKSIGLDSSSAVDYIIKNT
ncbi:1-deoxy-D-xylulose-5-phosphate synthase [Helicobacter sp. faydin-H76]|uniref:1-deoxy-D-xylulose-5-phosphate synthase n=2 Tax=Helicobacter cappadocius TaxID=3063998 RepID=A0AA90PL19_9HELI|nr:MULTISPECIES: 1-deoxy-D-xylulose-5-phosphate synthase [unclassified Helicobacter]MDO7253473.1 1-deoxy-D-xylulose-5-phosphate synthase [Helicobacter sp. faydin-H75]MDP2539400.1 1-deoxy-D-xylulose-5-phosphate synthase [Helicobacter sp. faydin-H76]